MSIRAEMTFIPEHQRTTKSSQCDFELGVACRFIRICTSCSGTHPPRDVPNTTATINRHAQTRLGELPQPSPQEYLKRESPSVLRIADHAIPEVAPHNNPIAAFPQPNPRRWQMMRDLEFS